MNLNGQISADEQVSLVPGADGGVLISGGGPALVQAITEIDSWTLFGNPGYHYTTAGITGSTEAGLDFGGWMINYNGSPVMAAADYGAWTPSNCASLGCAGVAFNADVAAVSWNGNYGGDYSLWYSWAFQDAAPGAAVPTYYLLHLAGSVTASPTVPLPPAAWLFGTALIGLVGVVRRRRVSV